jgi:hypothetical protein
MVSAPRWAITIAITQPGTSWRRHVRHAHRAMYASCCRGDVGLWDRKAGCCLIDASHAAYEQDLLESELFPYEIICAVAVVLPLRAAA